jgi:putative ABC transport system permease protein
MSTATTPEPGQTSGIRGSFDATLASADSTIAFRETVRLAVDSFKASKARFLLTMLGMIIGSASIVLVVTVGVTGKRYALDQISGIGPNMIEMQYVGGTVTGPDNTSSPDSMTREDMDTVVAQVPGIVAASPMLEFHDRVAIGSGVSRDTMLLGVSPQYKQVRNLKILAGRFFDDQDASSHTKVAVIVYTFAIELYGSPDQAVGRTIAISGIPFTVIGVFKEGTQTFGQSEISDQTMLIPYSVARYFQGTDTVKQIFFTVADTADVPIAQQQILDVIRSRHRATSVYNAFVLTEVLKVMSKIADSLTVVLIVAAFFTLLVSGVGIMNSMLANVEFRIREIGIRKALGATSREIRMQFLTEAVFLSLSGGIIGTLIGLAIPLVLSYFTPFTIPRPPWWGWALALLTSALVGIIFGTRPANRAAQLDPVETLKHE